MSPFCQSQMMVFQFLIKCKLASVSIVETNQEKEKNHRLFDNQEEIRYNLRRFVKQWNVYEFCRVS